MYRVRHTTVCCSISINGFGHRRSGDHLSDIIAVVRPSEAHIVSIGYGRQGNPFRLIQAEATRKVKRHARLPHRIQIMIRLILIGSHTHGDLGSVGCIGIVVVSIII